MVLGVTCLEEKLNQENYIVLDFNELDLIMAETAEIRSDIEFKEKIQENLEQQDIFQNQPKLLEKRKLLES